MDAAVFNNFCIGDTSFLVDCGVDGVALWFVGRSPFRSLVNSASYEDLMRFSCRSVSYSRWAFRRPASINDSSSRATAFLNDVGRLDWSRLTASMMVWYMSIFLFDGGQCSPTITRLRCFLRNCKHHLAPILHPPLVPHEGHGENFHRKALTISWLSVGVSSVKEQPYSWASVTFSTYIPTTTTAKGFPVHPQAG